MALCKSFLELTPLEQSRFAGMILHCVENDETFFTEGERMIKKAEKKGLFRGVEIRPENWSSTPPDETVTEVISES